MMIGPYLLIARHWEGTLQNVWVAQLPKDRKRLFALRIFDDTQAEARDRMMTWGCAMGQLEDPNMSGTIDLFFEGDLTVVVSELVIGESLRQVGRIVRGWSPMLAMSAVHQLAQSLKRLHELRGPDGQPMRFHHGAVNANRVMFDYEHPRVVLVEPGLEAVTQPQDAVTGCNPAADIYGLGCLLWELLTGRVPPESEPNRSRGPKLPSLKSLGVKCDKELEALVRCAVAPNPADRYTHLGAFIAGLERCMQTKRVPLNVNHELSRILRQRLQHRAHAIQTLVGRWTQRRRRPPETSDLQAPVPPTSLPPPSARTGALRPAAFAESLALSPGLTDDLGPGTSDLVAPQPKVLRIFRQLTWLALLGVVALAGMAYASTSTGQQSMQILVAWLTQLVNPG